MASGPDPRAYSHTIQAQSDLDSIYVYLDQRSPTVAQSVKNLLQRRIAALADFPFMAPQTREKGIFELTIVRYPYKVYLSGRRR